MAKKEISWSLSPSTIEQLFDVLAKFAEHGQALPPNSDLAHLTRRYIKTIVFSMKSLVDSGRIAVQQIPGSGYRKITILTGPQAGKAIETERRGAAKAELATAFLPVKAPVPAVPQPPRCQWCEKPFTRARARESASYCGKTCADAARSYGSLVTKRQVEARRAHVATQPKGAKSLDEFIQMGGRIYVEPPRQRYGAGA